MVDEEERNRIWVEFWLPILRGKDGQPNLEAIKNELADYYFMLQEVPKVYSHVTGGRFSNPDCKSETINAASDDHYEERFMKYLLESSESENE